MKENHVSFYFAFFLLANLQGGRIMLSAISLALSLVPATLRMVNMLFLFTAAFRISTV